MEKGTINKLFWIVGLLWLGNFGAARGADADAVVDILPSNVTSYRSENTRSQIIWSSDEEVIVGWQSNRRNLGYTNIFLQKINVLGEPIWEADGTPVSPFPSNQDNWTMVADGFGGAVVVWEDSRRMGSQPRIYMQRINLRGEPLWGKGGLAVCEKGTGAQRKPKVAWDRKNGFFVVWEDSRMGGEEVDLYGQHINLAGNINWGEEGLMISDAPGIQKNVTLDTDVNKNAYILWEDFRSGKYWGLYGQKLNREGDPYWKSGGLDIFPGIRENHHKPSIVPDGYGGLLFVFQKWEDDKSGYDLYHGRLNTVGSLLFQSPLCTSKKDQVNPQLVKRGSNALVCWEDRRDGNWDIYAQMLQIKDGEAHWPYNGVPVAKSPTNDRDPVVITATVYNYQVFSWLHQTEEGGEIRVQKLNNAGQPLWLASGVPVCKASKKQAEPAILPDDRGGLWCSWTDRREQGGSFIYTQHVNANGASLLKSEGLKLAADLNSVYAHVKGLKIIPSTGGNFFLSWEDFRNGKDNPDIYIQLIDSKGSSLWREGGVPVCTAAGEQSRIAMTLDGAGGVILSWIDRRNMKDDNIYAQRISKTGKLFWNRDGVAVCLAPRSQSQLRVVNDSKEGVIICWVDARNLKYTGFDLYIQRLNMAGEVLWGYNGRPFANSPGLQTGPTLVEDGKGGAYLAWMDSRTGISNIYAQHINPFGFEDWGRGGRCLSLSNYNQRNPEILRNKGGDLYVAWEDGRYGDGNEKVFMQNLNHEGYKLWRQEGEMICNFIGRQTKPRMASDKYGNLWVVWLDERSKSTTGHRLLAQRFDAGGNPKWDAMGKPIGDDMSENNELGLCINSRGYSFFVWNEKTENGKRNVFVQKVHPDGTRKMGFKGQRLGTDMKNQESSVLAINEEAQVMICWVESNPKEGSYSIRAKGIQ